MKKGSSPYLWVAFLVTIATALACNFPGLPGPRSPVGTPTLEVTGTPLSFSDATRVPTDTTTITIPTPTVTPEDADDECTLRAAFVEDVTIPDDTEVAPGEEFVKTWRIRNSGTCTWETGTTLIPISGDAFSGPSSVPVPETPPDEEVAVSVTLTAPTEPGTYRSDWQLQTPQERRYGGIFYVQIVVPEATASTPALTPTPPSSTGDITPPTDFLGAVSADCSEVSFTWGDGSGESGYKLEGPDLDADLNTNTTAYTWEDPPSGISVVTLSARDAQGNALSRLDTTVGVTCGGPHPDLSVTSITFQPTTPVAHLPLTATVRVENTGEGDSGAFMVRWWAVKTAPTSTCRWIVSAGLASGEAEELSCTTTAYSSPYATLLSAARVDTSNIIDEEDESNNTLEPEITVVNPEIVYDFVNAADTAEWVAGPPTSPLAWPGDPEDDQGYARWSSGYLETGGAVQGLCLETHPKRVANGWVRGEYGDLGTPDSIIEPGDHFRATLGLLEGSEEGAVTYRVMLILSESGSTWILTEPHSFGDGVEVLDIDLTPYAGQSAAVILRVDASQAATENRACWIEARIHRYP